MSPLPTETTLVYYNFRYYNPQDGRWTRRDIIPSKNLYDYTLNRSVSIVDFLGAIITPDVGQNFTRQVMDDIHHIDNQEYSADPRSGYNACNKYLQMSITPCIRNNKLENDSYPIQAKTICDGFIKMYTKNGKLRNAVLCVANCLAEDEKDNGQYMCCNKRNAMRLVSHVDCYQKCGFIMDLITKDNWGVPNGGWSLGLTSLIPDVIDSIIP